MLLDICIFLTFAEEGNSSCRNVQHNILASVNFLYIFLFLAACVTC